MAEDYGIPDPGNVNLTELTSTDDGMRAITCWVDQSSNEYEGSIGIRISSIFVILIVSTAFTLFPVLATRTKRVHIPLYLYLFARYFGAGVIVATAFVQYVGPVNTS